MNIIIFVSICWLLVFIDLLKLSDFGLLCTGFVWAVVLVVLSKERKQ
jgi:hypothetical protein